MLIPHIAGVAGGRVADNDKNALLSQEAKDYMAYMHTVYPEKCDPLACCRTSDVLLGVVCDALQTSR